MRFFGFDSFEGFGELTKDDIHSFYTDENFVTSLKNVQKRVNKAKKDLDAQLIKGFFNKTLKIDPSAYKILKAAIIFVDSDTYESSRDALKFCNNIIQEGTYIILDDFYSYRGSSSKGVKKAFDEFIKMKKCTLRSLFTYGMGGKVFVVDKAN